MLRLAAAGYSPGTIAKVINRPRDAVTFWLRDRGQAHGPRTSGGQPVVQPSLPRVSFLEREVTP